MGERYENRSFQALYLQFVRSAAQSAKGTASPAETLHKRRYTLAAKIARYVNLLGRLFVRRRSHRYVEVSSLIPHFPGVQ